MLGKIVLTNHHIQIPASSNRIDKNKHAMKESDFLWSESKKYDIFYFLFFSICNSRYHFGHLADTFIQSNLE